MIKRMTSGGTTKGKGTLIILIFLLCIVALLVIYQNANAKSSVGDSVISNPSINSELKSSLKYLIATGKKITASDSQERIVLKWQGTISSSGDPSTKAAELSAQLGLDAPSSVNEDGHMTYRSAGVMAYEAQLSLFWSELGEGASYVIVTLDTSDLKNEESIQSIADGVSATLEQNSIDAEWNISFQGITNQQGTPAEVLKQTEAELHEHYEAVSAKESYEDVATVSRTYSIPELNRSVVSGNHVIAAQIAVHQEDQKGSNRVTIGYPLITIEY